MGIISVPAVFPNRPGRTALLVTPTYGMIPRFVRLAGADIVEFNPRRDPQEITAMVAAKVLKEVAARMLELPFDPEST